MNPYHNSPLDGSGLKRKTAGFATFSIPQAEGEPQVYPATKEGVKQAEQDAISRQITGAIPVIRGGSNQSSLSRR